MHLNALQGFEDTILHTWLLYDSQIWISVQTDPFIKPTKTIFRAAGTVFSYRKHMFYLPTKQFYNMTIQVITYDLLPIPFMYGIFCSTFTMKINQIGICTLHGQYGLAYSHLLFLVFAVEKPRMAFGIFCLIFTSAGFYQQLFCDDSVII